MKKKRKSCHCVGNALSMSFGMLSSPFGYAFDAAVVDFSGEVVAYFYSWGPFFLE